MVSAEEWRRARAEGAGLLSGSEHWDEAARPGASGEARLNFAEMWAYMEWRPGWLARTFGADADGNLTEHSRAQANAALQVDEIAVAQAARSVPVRPAQALGIVNALFLAALLAAFYRFRKREGQVFGLLAVLYPMTRFVLESIRSDNPHDLLRGVLTHNQYTSLAMAVGGGILLLVISRLPASAGPTWAERLQRGPGRHGPELAAARTR